MPGLVNYFYSDLSAPFSFCLTNTGFGNSPDSDAVKTDQNRVDLLWKFMEALGVRTAVLLSPSMSGHYSIPFLMKHSVQLHGFISIAPVGTRSYTPEQYQGIQVRYPANVKIEDAQNVAIIFPMHN